MWTYQGHQIVKITIIIFFKKKQELTLSDLNTYSKALMVNTEWYWHKDWRRDHWNQIGQKWASTYIINWFFSINGQSNLMGIN